MREDCRNRSWFALLRRDRLAFALTAIFLVVTQLLRPLAAAPATTLDAGTSICRFAEASSFAPTGNRASDTHACQHCMAGPCAGLALTARADAAGPITPRPCRDLGKPAHGATMLLSGLAGDPPPAIRAPPSLV